MKKNYLFLGFAIPNEEMEKVFVIEQFPQVQTHKFNWNLIKGIEYCNAMECTYISARPITNYPSFPQKKIPSSNWNINLNGKNIEITEISFVNTNLFKLISRFLSTLRFSLKKYHKVENKGGIIVYSVHVPYMLVGCILAKVYNIDYIAIWTDPPSIINFNESSFKKKLRKIEYLLSKFLMKKASKVIALTKYLAEDFAPGKPCLVIEGIIDVSEMKLEQVTNEGNKNNPQKIVYSGSLQERYGIKNIVDGFLLSNCENMILEIYGRGDYEEELKKISSCNKKIIYHGYVANHEVLKIQRDADFLINARPAEEDYVKYSFPSKTLEYMLSGTPLVTTMLAGIPDEYRNYVFVLKNNKPETISNMIKKLSLISEGEKYHYGIKAREYAVSRDYKIQGEKIVNFIESELS